MYACTSLNCYTEFILSSCYFNGLYCECNTVKNIVSTCHMHVDVKDGDRFAFACNGAFVHVQLATQHFVLNVLAVM